MWIGYSNKMEIVIQDTQNREPRLSLQEVAKAQKRQ
jgi:hypothetical protein